MSRRDLGAGEMMLKLAEHERQAAMQALADLNEERRQAEARMQQIQVELNGIARQRQEALAGGISAGELAAFDAAASGLMAQQTMVTETLDGLAHREQELMQQWLASDGKQKGLEKHLQKQQRQLDRAEERHAQQKLDDLAAQRMRGAKL